MHLKLFVDPAHVEGNGVYSHPQLLRSRLVVVPVHQQPEQPGLVRSQLVIDSCGRPDDAEQVDDPAGDF